MNKKEKSDNRKALPKFLITLLLSMLVGAVLGFVLSFIKSNNFSDTAAAMIQQFLGTITPYAAWAALILFAAVDLTLYKQANTLFRSWDGENESVMEQADQKLSWLILWTSLHLILSFFFLSPLFLLGDTLFLKEILSTLLGFFCAMAFIVVMQQKAIDLTRKMNPEKKGSIYDMKFHKKWLASCDENEKQQIGQAAYRAFMAVTYTCITLWLLLFLLSLIYPVGILPFFVITLIWGISQVVYCLEAIRMGRH